MCGMLLTVEAFQALGAGAKQPSKVDLSRPCMDKS